jgi:oligopeptidase B
MTSSLNNISMAQTNNGGSKPPVAKKVPRTDKTNDDVRVDDYFWMREKTNPEVVSYLEAENAYTDSVMNPTIPLQKKLYDEMLGHIKQTDKNVPYHYGDYYYYSRTEAGKQYSIYCRKRGSLDAKEEITLDLNELAKGLKFLTLNAYEVSDDGNLLAFSLDKTGYRQYILYVKDLRTGKLSSEQIERTHDVMWAADNKTLFYTTEDPVNKRTDSFYRHTLGTDKSDLIYQEKDEQFDLSANRTKDQKFIFLTVESKTASEVRYLPSDKPMADLRLVLPRAGEHKYFLDHRGDLFYIRTNMDAKNYRVMTVPVTDPQQKNWRDFIPHRREVKIDDIDLFANHCVVSEREGGLQKLRIINFKDNNSHHIAFTEPVYTATTEINPEFNTKTLRFRFQSLVTPNSVFSYDMDTHERTLLKQTEVLGGFDPARYTSERAYATASDGTRIPLSIVYRKGIKLDGKNPMLLYAYGSYGSSSPPSFSSNRLSLLDRGVIYAIAHIRGGGEMGEDWREQGRMMQKRNTFTDFIASAEYLVKAKYTSSDRLIIQGASAGGLLMGAVSNMRPDLFKAVIAQVPFVDVMNTMLDASIPLTAVEYLEWGNPNEKAAYTYMKSYSPYDNIKAQPYPAMLVKVSYNDSQVPYWEGTKFVAKLRATKTDNNLLLLKVNMGAGHGGSSGRYDALKDVAFDYAFMMMQWGITQ